MTSESDATFKKNETSLPLKTLGKYQIERKLGQGGMGTVYLATNTDLKKLVALKVLPRDKAKNPILVRRFKAEAQAAGQLEHPNIVAVYDSGEADGYLYIAMEYVEGIDLFEQVKRRGVIPVKRSIEIIKQVAQALQHAYEHNIVHRDIKPSNLLLKQDGTVKVTDLGLARSIDDTLETNITRAGTTVGTVDYMAPEQARSSKSADVRSDIYSLGCTWYQMLTGEAPFSDGSVTNKLQAHAIKPLPDPREMNENIPEGLFAVLQRMTAKKPSERYQTPAELLDDLANAKLTKAAFSNEIFSDLSDYDMDAVQRYDEQIDAEDEEIIPAEDPPRRKKLSRTEQVDDDAPAETTRRKPRSRVEKEDEIDEPDEDGSFPKPIPKSTEARTIDDSQQLKSRSRPPLKPANDEDDENVRSVSKRPDSGTNDEEVDDPVSSRRKSRSSPTNEPSSPGTKNGKSSSRPDPNEKRGAKHAPKALPPKRAPTSSDDQNRSQFPLESLKYLGIVAGIMSVIGGLGWLVFQWSNQVDTAKNPFVHQRDLPVETTVVTPIVQPKPIEPTESETQVSTTAEPTKPVSPGRPATNEYDIARQSLPAWASPEALEPTDLPIVSVGTGTTSGTHFSSLDEALRASDATGGVIRLLGNGPFLLTKVDLTNGKRIVITAATPLDQPLIIFSQPVPGAATGLTMNGGQLDLRGLHFAFNRSASNNPSPTVMISVVDGQLSIRKCSFTAMGNASVGATALAVLSTQDSQNTPVILPEVLLDHVTVRGDGFTAMKIDRTMADVIIQDSLFVTGTAPVIDLSGTLNSAISDTTEGKPRRTIRVIRSTLSGRKQLLEVAALNTIKPPTTSILFRDSICTAEGAGNNAVLLSAVRWPSITSPSNGWLTNLNWTSVSSLFIGFERLIDLDKSSFKVAGLEAWQRVWGKKFEPAQIQSFYWQESVFSDLSTVMPYDFDNAKLPFHDLKTASGNLPGCATNQLKVPSFISESRLQAFGQRPKLPVSSIKSTQNPQLRKINLLKEDLGLILNKNDWQSGTVFEVTGTGLQTMLPARIVGKSLRIVFRQGEGAPLRIQPKVSDSKGKIDGSALFSIEKGTLELQSAVIESSQTAKTGAPAWLIFARNSNLVLNDCQLSGPMQQELPQFQGLIVWSTTILDEALSRQDAPILSVQDSVLMSTGVGIRFQSAMGNLFLRNCIVAVRGYGIDLQPVTTGTALLPVIDLQQVTLSASKAAFRVEAVTPDIAITSPMRLFVENCAVVSPLEFKPGEAAESAIVECAGPVVTNKQLQWWGTSNGFAKELKVFLRESGTEPVVSTAGWHAVWGETNDLRLLTGPKGVQLKVALPNRWTSLKPLSFLLDPTSAGATWAEGGRPIGADLNVIEELASSRKMSSEAKAGTSGPSTKSGTAPPIGKKNVGF